MSATTGHLSASLIPCALCHHREDEHGDEISDACTVGSDFLDPRPYCYCAGFVEAAGSPEEGNTVAVSDSQETPE